MFLLCALYVFSGIVEYVFKFFHMEFENKLFFFLVTTGNALREKSLYKDRTPSLVCLYQICRLLRVAMHFGQAVT